VVEFSVLGDRSVEDLLREIICSDVPSDGNGIPSKFFDFFNDKLRFLFVEAAETDMSINSVTGKQGKRTR
jgi:hypothetical protein